MGYTYSLATLRRRDFTSNVERSSIFYLMGAGDLELAIGEFLYMQLEISTTTNFTNGQTFFINWNLFAPLQRNQLAANGTGWRIDITEPSAGLLVATATLVAGNNSLNQNYRLIAANIPAANNAMALDFVLFVTNDTKDWLGNFTNNNTARWLQSAVNANTALTQNSGVSAYRNANSGFSFFEIYAYETTNGSSPSSAAFADPFVRMPTNVTVKQISKRTKIKWYDTHFNNAQSWTSTSELAYNGLGSITAKYSPTSPVITNIKRVKYPFLSDTIDLNFEPNSQLFPRSLNYTGYNYFNANILLGTVLSPAAIDRVTARIIRVDNINSTTDFYTALEANENDIPLLNGTAAPNWLNGGFFGTPTAVTQTPGNLSIQFLVDGTKLQYKARYRLVFIVYDTTTDFVSTHISPELIADFAAPADIGIPDTNVRTYNTQHPNSNDVTLSLFERFELLMNLDKTVYTGGVFNDELQLVEVEEIQGGNVLNRWTYNFAPNANNINSGIDIVLNDATDLTVSLTRRAGYATPLLVALTNYTYRWKFTFNQLTIGGTQSNTYQLDMLIKVKPIDAARINGITFLDAADFDASIETPIAYICAGDTEVVVKIEKNGAPDANLIGLMLQGIFPNPPVFENAAYVSPVGLPNINSAIMQQVETTFVDDFAYYRIDLTAIAGANSFFAGALIYNL